MGLLITRNLGAWRVLFNPTRSGGTHARPDLCPPPPPRMMVGKPFWPEKSTSSGLPRPRTPLPSPHVTP
ncbi:hypothetical protein [Acetobacter orleanensis]|uniref:hypothetical protein n=1 Tax=Acetobacter orleanensis TaxID=104099 RepID=UPI000A54281F|nr:hypothetical protein [Acetobacter orleanensis]